MAVQYIYVHLQFKNDQGSKHPVIFFFAVVFRLCIDLCNALVYKKITIINILMVEWIFETVFVYWLEFLACEDINQSG